MRVYRLLTTIVLAALIAAPVPAFSSDNCSAPTVISALPFADVRDTSGATTAPDDPPHSCRGNNKDSHSFWYRFTATTSGKLTAFTHGSDYDTVLSVHTGACGTLTEVACNDDLLGGPAQVTFNATNGTTYLFEVTSFGTSAGGNLHFGLAAAAPAANDACASPTVVGSTPFLAVVDASAATTAPSDPLQSCSFEAPAQNLGSVWYRFTPPSDGTVTVSTAASSYDTVLTAYVGACNSPQELACSDDVGVDQFESRVEIEVDGGTPYLFEVTEFEEAEDRTLHFSLTFTSSEEPPPPARGVQLTPDGKRTLVNKDVGAERWAISLNDDNTVTGNVFRSDGGAPAFIFCSPLAQPNSFRCFGADACTTETCTDQYVLIADVTLPGDFFTLPVPCGEDYSFIADVTLPASFFSPH